MIRGSARGLAIAIGLTLASLTSAEPPAWTVAPDTSTVTMYATKQGDWFDGVFADFDATIAFDPASPATGTIAGVVRTDSIETGDSQNNAYVRQSLEVDAFPEARFESTSIEATPEALLARGELTLVGQTRPAVLQFRFESDESSPDRASFFGELNIDRFEFDIASDIDTGRAGRIVTVQIALDLRR